MSHDLSRLGQWGDLPFFRETLAEIDAKLAAETSVILPQASLRFRALELVPPAQVKLVILGQDPYHSPGKADGLAFSIPQGFGGRLDSLGNIFKELEADLGIRRSRTDLSDWAAQGVLLLNTALTVPQGKAGGHARLGWTALVRQVLYKLDPQPRAMLLWGRPAQKYGRAWTNPKHLKIETAHPSPLSAHRGFFGSRPFSRVNQWLEDRGEAPIAWGHR